MTSEYDKKKNDFLSGRIKGCRAYFEEHKHYTEAAYCCIILDRPDRAQALFELAKDYDPRAKWGLLLLQFIKDDIHSFPTYFQIRNFLEIDLGLLILYCKGNYIDKILRYADYLAYYNPECYKFIGRVFWANNLMSASMLYLKKAKDKFYHDPELHYLLAYIYYYHNKNIKECHKALRTCLEILPKYAPAINLAKQTGMI